MSLVLSFFALSAFATPPESVLDGVRVALSHRHAISCEDLDRHGSPAQVLEATIWVADNVPAPPWAGLNAVGCIAEKAGSEAVALEAAQRWMADPGLPGYAITIAKRFDRLPESMALDLAQRGMHHRQQRALVRSQFDQILLGCEHQSVSALISKP
jgi:hypothetical protein